MKKLLAVLALLVFTGLALANSTADGTLNPAAVSDYTDKSVFYLSQIFGTVGGVLTGQSSQMMGQIFYKLNWGIFLVSGVVVLYAVLLAAIRLSSEGVAIAQGKSALFMLIKLAIGVTLVIPNSGTGYSLLQNIVMQVVVKGVGLADSVWNYGLDYLNEGGVIWSAPSPEVSNSRYDNIITDANQTALIGSDTALASQVFRNAVCMVGSRDPLTSSSTDNNRPYYDVQADQDNTMFRFPGLNDKDLSGSSCGTVSWNISEACKDKDSVSCATAQGALSSLIDVLIPAAKSYYCMKADADSSFCQTVQAYSNLDDDMSPVLFNSMMNYYPTIQVYADMQLTDVSDKSKDFIETAKAEGWLMAGRYYWDIMQFIDDSGKLAELSNYTKTSIVAPTQGDLSATDTLKDIVGSAGSDFSNVSKSQAYIDYENSLYTQADVPTEDTHGGDGGHFISTGAVAGVGAAGVATAYVAPITAGFSATLVATLVKINQVADMFHDFEKKNYNPIEFMYKLGKKCIEVTITIWAVGGILLSATVMAASVCSAMNPMGFAVRAMTEWVKPIFMVIAIGFWGAGFFLSYYVPLYPYMMFLFASVGWFISVIEAMVAAPLVALGLTHPEDHDLLGKAQQAVMLLLSVFLQPALLVVGLIAGMIFCYVSFQLLIYTFSGFMLDVMRDASQVAMDSNILGAVKGSKLFSDANILIQPLLLVIFCMIAYVLLTQSYSLIHVLRDNVMRWIGAPQSGAANPEQLVGEVKGTVNSYGKQTGDTVGQMALGQSGHDTKQAGESAGRAAQKGAGSSMGDGSA